jgi:tetratricopeptide (TPR) repeat protein
MRRRGTLAGGPIGTRRLFRRAQTLLVAVWVMSLLTSIAVAGQVPPSAPVKPRLAVIPFSGSADALPEGYGAVPSQGIYSALKQMRAVRVVEPGEITEALGRLGLSLSSPPADEVLIRLARELQVRGLIAGTYAAEGETVRIQARLVDLASPGQIIDGEAIRSPAGEFLAAPRRITGIALQQFRTRLTEWDERRLETAFIPGTTSLQAYTFYARAAWEQGLGTKDAQEQAVGLFTKALEADQNFALAHMALGVSLYATSTTGNPSNRWKASQEYRKAIQLNSKLAEAHKLLGDMLVTSPRRLYDQATQAYQAAIEIWPDYAEARVGLGDARQAKGQHDEAIEEYKKALAIEPSNARVHLGMGKIYYNEKQLYHEAVAAYQQAIALDPKLLDAHLSLGELYEEKGLYQDAVTRYSHVLSLEPKHPGAMYGLALAYERLDVKKAMEQWEQYIELASQLPSEKDWVDIAKKHLGKLQRGEKPN